MKVKLDNMKERLSEKLIHYQSILEERARKLEGILDKIRKTLNVNIRISESVFGAAKTSFPGRRYSISNVDIEYFCTSL